MWKYFVDELIPKQYNAGMEVVILVAIMD